jgi:predicted NACHT family NTPase
VLRKTSFCWNRNLSENDEKILQKLLPKSRVLWLLDGYDELMQPTPTHLQNLLEKLLKTADHLVTSRPYQNTLSYKVRMEIIGFTDENIRQYISQFFDQVETKSSSSSAEENRLLNFLKLNPRIWGIALIPINLELICSVWSNNDWSETKTMTVSMLYGKLSEWLC